MARDGGFSAIAGVDIDVMSGAVPMEMASGGFQLADEVSSFHTGTSISLV